MAALPANNQEMLVKVLRIVFFLLIVFLAMPEFVIGSSSLYHALQSLRDVWFIRHEYVLDAAVTLIPGLLALLCAGFAAFRPARQHNWVLFVFATGIVLLEAVALPSWLSSPLSTAHGSTMERMREIDTAVTDWAPEHQHYPRSASEVEEALQHSSFQRQSPYQRGSHRLDYEVVTMANATGPALKAAKPAVLFYSVDAAGERYWITGTTLPAVVSDHSSMLTEMSYPYAKDKPFVIEGKLEPPAPVAAKPGKK